MPSIGYNITCRVDDGGKEEFCSLCMIMIFDGEKFMPCGEVTYEWDGTGNRYTDFRCGVCGNHTQFHAGMQKAKKKEAEEPELPTHTKPLLGLRKWIVKDDSILWSTGINQKWDTSAPMKAQCQHNVFSWVSFGGGVGEHEAPNKGCGCGLYAFYDLPALQKEFSKDVVTVAGVVSAWGKVIECENGMRAEYMQLEAFVLDQQTIRVLGAPVSVSPILRLLAKKHNVPLILPGEIGSFAGEKDLIKLKPQKKALEAEYATLPYPPLGTTGYRFSFSPSGIPIAQPTYTQPDPPEDDTGSVVALSGFGKWKRIIDRKFGKGNKNG